MLSDEDLGEIISKGIEDITRRVVHVDLQAIPPAVLRGDHMQTFLVNVRGDYDMTIAFCADLSTLQKFAKSMRRGMETDANAAIAYSVEYVNILCGRIVSAINNATHTSARFGIPHVVPGAPRPGEQFQVFYYQNRFGPIQVQAAYREQ